MSYIPIKVAWCFRKLSAGDLIHAVILCLMDPTDDLMTSRTAALRSGGSLPHLGL